MTSNRLTHLAAQINAEHRVVRSSFKDVVDHAIRAGDLLIAAKELVGKHGEWLPWLQINCDVGERAAQNYMKIARELPKLPPAKTQALAYLGIEATLAALGKPAPLAVSSVTVDGKFEVVEVSDSANPEPLPPPSPAPAEYIYEGPKPQQEQEHDDYAPCPIVGQLLSRVADGLPALSRRAPWLHARHSAPLVLARARVDAMTATEMATVLWAQARLEAHRQRCLLLAISGH